MTDPSSQPEVPGFLRVWAGKPGPKRILAAARDRLERGRLGPRAHLAVGLTPAERRDVGQLLDATWAGSGDAVPLRALRAGLAAHGTSLEALLVVIGGSLHDLPAERRQQEAGRAGERAEAVAALMALLDFPVPPDDRSAVAQALAHWIIRDHPGRARAVAVRTIVVALPWPQAGPPRRLAAVAVGLTGDAHALDRSRSLGRAVARFLALRAAIAAGQRDFATDPIGTTDCWREAWAGAGVACDTVSPRVLVLNLPLVGTAPAVAACAATPGEPVWLSLRAVTGQLELARPIDVFVCENPTIVEAAADRLGARCQPLVCTFGRPDAAAITLLRAIAPRARPHIRADGDSAGWSIVNGLLAELPKADRWRMPDGLTQFEEELLDELVADLGRSGEAGTRL